MSRLISDILQAPEPRFSQLVRQWEDLSDRPGIDVRLALEIKQGLAAALTSLALDPEDTTGEELYHSLMRRASQDNVRLAGHITVADSDSPEAMAAKVVTFVGKLPIARPAWTTKPSVVRQYLRAQPPKKLMKIYGLRSIDSALKRSSPAEFLALGKRVESPEWTTKLYARYKKLQINDFDEEKAELLIIPAKHAAALRKAGYSLKEMVVPARELGAVLIVPAKARFDGDVLLLVNMLVEAMRERRMYATFFRNLSRRPKFGEKIVRTLQKGVHATAEEIHGTSWSALHGLAARSQSPQLHDFGPGLEFDDPEIPSAAMILAGELPEFSFWQTTFVAKHAPDGPVSCHLTDVIMNSSSKAAYQNRIAHHLQANLWDEFRIRYLLQEPVARRVLNDL